MQSFLRGAQTAEDGTTFKETTFRLRRSTWAISGTTTLVRALPDEPRERNYGAHTMEFYARKFLNARVGDFDRTVLHHIPWKFGRMLWEDAVKTGRDTFMLWSAFCTVYPTHIHELERRRAYQLHFSESIPTFVRTITDTAKYRGIVDLDLSSLHSLDRTELLELSGIPGLRRLRVRGTSDSIVRSWARTRGKGMSRLKSLSIMISPNVTENTLEYASWFPKLRHLELHGTQVDPIKALQSTKWGWDQKHKVYVQEEDEQEKAEPLLEITFTPDLQGPGWLVDDRAVMHTKPMNFYRELGEAVKRQLREEDERREQKKAGQRIDARPAPTVRKHRLKGMGDMLSELSAPPRKRRQ